MGQQGKLSDVPKEKHDKELEVFELIQFTAGQFIRSLLMQWPAAPIVLAPGGANFAQCNLSK